MMWRDRLGFGEAGISRLLGSFFLLKLQKVQIFLFLLYVLFLACWAGGEVLDIRSGQWWCPHEDWASGITNQSKSGSAQEFVEQTN